MNLSPEDRDYLIRTVYGEAAGEDPTGQQAVAAVILNRARERGMSPKDVVLQKHQFEPWGSRAKQLMALDPAGQDYQGIAQNIDPFLSGQVPSPVGGADHFFAPGLQSDLGRSVPKWAQGQSGTQLGRHTFYDLEGQGAGTPQPQTSGSPQNGNIAGGAQAGGPMGGMSPEQAAQALSELGGPQSSPFEAPTFKASIPQFQRRPFQQYV